MEINKKGTCPYVVYKALNLHLTKSFVPHLFKKHDMSSQKHKNHLPRFVALKVSSPTAVKKLFKIHAVNSEE